MDRTPGINAAAITNPGMRRQVNEDSLAIPPPDLSPDILARKGHLYLVADGLGGHKAGDVASSIAASVVPRLYYEDPSTEVGPSLQRAIETANAEVYRRAEDPALDRMGTTVVAVVVRGKQLTVAHVGDSRAYLIGRDGIRLLTGDHTWVAEQVRNGLLTPEQARMHGQRHVLTRSLGRIPQVEISLSHGSLRPGDQVLLCSDGLSGVVGEADLLAIVQGYSPQQAVQQLVLLANQRGGPDNITAIVVAPNLGPASFATPATSPSLQRPLANAAAWLLALSPQRWLLVAGSIAIAVLLASACLAAIVITRPKPSEQPAQLEPVNYVVLPGDTPEDIAQYFQASAATLPPVLESGQTVAVTLNQVGLFFSGKVARVNLSPEAAKLVLDDGLGLVRVGVDLAATPQAAMSGAAPDKGDIIQVFGYHADSTDVNAVIVNVWRDGVWQNWYAQNNPSPVWVKASIGEHLLPPPASGGDLAGQQVLVRGTWDLDQAAAGPFARLDYHAQDLFVLRGESYHPLVPSGQPLSERLGAATNGVPQATRGLDPSPGTTPTLAPTLEATTARPETIEGEVTATSGLRVREGPSMGALNSGLLKWGERVRILCKTTDIRDGRDRWWYQIAFNGGLQGYAAERWIQPLGDNSPELIPICGTE